MNNTKYKIGVDLGGTKIAVGLCLSEQILKKTVVSTDASGGFENIVKKIINAYKEVSKGIDKTQLCGIGVGAAGQINSTSGEVVYAPNLGWNNKPLGSMLQELTNLPVNLINDVRAATIAEHKYGNGIGLENFANIFIGTGVGSGFVINGKLLSGATNSAGEIGHICMDPDGPLCACGHRGCLETYCSGSGMQNYIKDQLSNGRTSIIKELADNNLNNIKGPLIAIAAQKNDELALEAIDRVGKYLGIAIANLHTMLNLDVVLLGGGMMALKPFFANTLESSLHNSVLPVANNARVLYKEAKFQSDAVIIGSAATFA